MKRASILIVSAVLLCGGLRAVAATMPKRDEQLIKTLLERLKERKDLKFIRENKTYDAKTAAWYLRYKWDQNKDKVHSVEDFIQLSSYGGEHGEVTYYVQFSDGKREPAKVVLEESVKKLEAEE